MRAIPALFETVTRRGYRFIAHVEDPLDNNVAANQIGSPKVEAADSPLIGGGDEFKSDLELVKRPEIELPGAGKSDNSLKAKTAREISRTSLWKTLLAAG